MGPVVTAASRDKILGYIEEGIAAGADLVVDGRDVSLQGYENGFFLGPTLFDRVAPGISIWRDEIFAPVLAVVRVADMSFRVLHHPVGADDGIAECFGADDHLLVFIEEDDRRRGEFTFLVGERGRFTVLVEVGQAGVGGAEVDSDRVGSVGVHVQLVHFVRLALWDDRATTSSKDMARRGGSMLPSPRRGL